MKPVLRTSLALAVATTAGASAAVIGAAPAFAASEACGPNDGTLIAPGVCEVSFTSGTATFTPTAEMTTLEVLLVGAGGSGAQQPDPNTNGYAAGGGGGEVKVVDFSGTTDAIAITVPEPGTTGGVTTTSTAVTVANGVAGTGSQGGASGNGNAGTNGGSASDALGGGGGAGAAAVGADGGAGVVVSDLVAAGSLFADDSRCFGGGGAASISTLQGIPGCGGGAADASGIALVPAAANSGGGGGGVQTPLATGAEGARGIVVLRWTAARVTVTFDTAGRVAAPAAQSIVAGATATAPAAPTADGFRFEGWFTDAAFTTPADFSAPVTASATYYARWTPVLPETGAEASPVVLTGALLALLAGGALAVGAARHRRRSAEGQLPE